MYNMTSVSLLFRSRVLSVFDKLKHNRPTDVSPVLPVTSEGQIISTLRVVSAASIRNREEIRAFAKWRRANDRYFPSQFRVTVAGTTRWAKEQLIDNKDRILFMIENLDEHAIGHVGLYRFDFKEKSCEIDNVIRGISGVPGVMSAAVNSLCQWGEQTLGITTYYLHVVAENSKAVDLYKRCGFVEIERTGIRKVVSTPHMVTWEAALNGNEPGLRHLLRMKKAR